MSPVRGFAVLTTQSASDQSSRLTSWTGSSLPKHQTKSGSLTSPTWPLVKGWLYLAVVLDLYSRMVVGWSMQRDMSTQLVSDAMTMALWRRRPDTAALLHHSDQGTQYWSEAYQALLEENGIACSMSRAGNVWDNSAMESFFSSMKSERVYRSRYRTRDEARSDIFDYIERFYNPQRRHSTRDYLSPVIYEWLETA